MSGASVRGYWRKPLSPRGFREACARLEQIHPDASETSAKRSPERNERVGGNPESKHLIGMARDYVWDVEPDEEDQRAFEHEAKILGLWARYHDGHLHVQGLPPGEIPAWWMERYK